MTAHDHLAGSGRRKRRSEHQIDMPFVAQPPVRRKRPPMFIILFGFLGFFLVAVSIFVVIHSASSTEDE